MEGFLESFLYLLITIIILVLSMRKKKQIEAGGPVEEQSTEDPFSEAFGEEDHEGYEGLEHEPHPAYQGKSEGPSPWMTDSEARSMKMDADKILKDAAENPIAIKEGLVEEDAYGIRTGSRKTLKFDLKKAVIYSEILEKRVF